MRATRRRRRKLDPLASPHAVRNIIEQLRAALPEITPEKEKDLIKMLRAVRHVQRYPATDTKRGRPGRWSREDLLKVMTRLNEILDRETSSHISTASFIDHYMRLLHFPAEIIEALGSGDINLFEAEQLARITPERLGVTPARAKRTLTEIFSTHLQTKASGMRLRQRVNELFKKPNAEARHTDTVYAESNALEDFDPYDPTHLFWEQLKQLGFAFREIRREDVLDEEIEELLRASEPIMAVLSRIQRRKEHRKLPKLIL